MYAWQMLNATAMPARIPRKKVASRAGGSVRTRAACDVGSCDVPAAGCYDEGGAAMKFKAASAALIVLLAYLCGYSWLGVYKEAEQIDDDGNRVKAAIRVYDREWQARIYIPLARAETLVTGVPTGVGTWADFSQ
jgi:hypothetical protein